MSSLLYSFFHCPTTDWGRSMVTWAQMKGLIDAAHHTGTLGTVCVHKTKDLFFALDSLEGSEPLTGFNCCPVGEIHPICSGDLLPTQKISQNSI